MIDTLTNTIFWRKARYYLIDTLTGKETMNEACEIGAVWLKNSGRETDIYDKNYMDELSMKIWSGKSGGRTSKCTLSACIIQHEINAGRPPCDGYNEDRNICRGGPRKEITGNYPRWIKDIISDHPEMEDRILKQHGYK